MGFLAALEQRRAAVSGAPRVNRSHDVQVVSQETGWMIDAIDIGRHDTAGVSVNRHTAMNMVTVHACVSLLAGTVASLPLVTFERLTEGRARATGHRVYSVLHDQPNGEIDAFQYNELAMVHLLLAGNQYAEIERDRGGRILALWPLLPHRTWPRRVNGIKEYVTHTPDGERHVLPANRVLHVAGLGYDGMVGYNPITHAARAIGIGLAGEQSAANFFANGFNPGGLLIHPEELDDNARKRLKKEWRENRSGLSNHHRVAILEEGMKYEKIGVDPKAAQVLESREFSVEEIARFYGVPPHLVGHVGGSTSWGSGIEQQTIGFATYTLQRWTVRIEKRMNISLFTAAERQRYYVKYQMAALLRGDSKTRAEALGVMRDKGIINADEWRELEDMNPQEGGQGKLYLVQLNMIPADQLAQAASADDDAGDSATRSRTATAAREHRSVTARRRLRASHERLFRAAGERILRREIAGVRSVVKRWASQRARADLLVLLKRFYDQHRDEVRVAILAPVQVLAAAVQEAIGNELGTTQDTPPEMERFASDYANAFQARHVASSFGQLRQLIQEAEEEDGIEADIGQRLDEWEETRADKIGVREAAQAVNALARTAYILAGVQTLRWVTGPNSCPICQSMNGIEVAAGRPFMRAGDTAGGKDGGEGQSPLTVETDVHHPPLHDGCTCDLAPA